jgi:hypothetical protein
VTTRAGVTGTEFGGVFFTDAVPRGWKRLGAIEVTISRQNANLAEVKTQMVDQVKRRGGNALVAFRYGQKAHAWWQNILPMWDSESWYGSGEAAVSPVE